jgi:uncharacterized protein YbjQ (UPF0145 family)
MEVTNCPNCSAPIKDGVFSSNVLMPADKTEGMNLATGKNAEAWCEKCYGNNIIEAKSIFYKKLNLLQKSVDEVIPLVPIITLQVPHGWDYQVLSMITAQSVTGEGALTEFFSGWNEFWGTESNRFNQKIKEGEDKCKNRLRLEALKLGGNAVIGNDVDFAEVGGAKGMMMVCMAGTAIKLNNVEILGADRKPLLEKLADNAKELNEYQKYTGFFA